LGGPADHERLDWLQRELSPLPHASLLSVLNTVPLLELAHHLCQCDGYLGNDSGITHLAALLGLPTLALFGPSDPVTWRPLGCSVSVLSSPELGNLAVDVVVPKLESLLV
ncbi:MAG: glycosyltransferase family 9 protein, partial [Ktedonobacteraceae bacterium]|nr:glycosyltransferase family 9 protein [Ktedonobacteraceae bacterium]